jgi:hypothetical protein
MQGQRARSRQRAQGTNKERKVGFQEVIDSSWITASRKLIGKRLMGREPKSARRTAVVSEIRHTFGTQPNGGLQKLDPVASGSNPVTEPVGILKRLYCECRK